MGAARLILVEGMIGSGKTTTATRLGDWLARQGENARVFCEGAADHPIRTRAEDRLRAAAGPQAPGQPGSAAGGGAGSSPRAYADDQWRHRIRGEPWSSRNVAFVENSAWALRRNLQGQDAVVRLYQAWEPVAARLYSRYPFPKIMVTDPQRDWAATLARICAAIRPSHRGGKPRPAAAEPAATPPASQPQDRAE